MVNTLRLKSRLTAIRATRHKAAGVLDDGAYRAILERAAKVKSSTEIRTLAQADAVLDEFRRLGLGGPAARKPGPAKPANEWAFVFRLTPDRQTYARKIYRLAEKIGARQRPPVPVMPKAWVEGTARQMLGLNRPECREATETRLELCEAELLHKIVQALKVFIARQGWNA